MMLDARLIHCLLRADRRWGGTRYWIGIDGRLSAGRTENLHDYLIPTIGDVPRFEHIIVEVADAEGPYGAKGLGEHVLIPTAPAIVNAIRQATGVLITHLPALLIKFVRHWHEDKQAQELTS